MAAGQSLSKSNWNSADAPAVKGQLHGLSKSCSRVSEMPRTAQASWPQQHQYRPGRCERHFSEEDVQKGQATKNEFTLFDKANDTNIHSYVFICSASSELTPWRLLFWRVTRDLRPSFARSRDPCPSAFRRLSTRPFPEQPTPLSPLLRTENRLSKQTVKSLRGIFKQQ